jgi:hypothetical protein
LKNEKLIINFFKKILNEDIAYLVVDYTNLRISLIDLSKISNNTYRKQQELLIGKKITIDEMYSFIGLLILFGLTGNSDVSNEEIWSEKSAHYTQYAVVTMSRDRFQLIKRNLCFDNITTRNIRKTNKLYKIEEVFMLFKKNLKLITPSSCLCIDETLHAFVGSSYQQSQHVMKLSIGVWSIHFLVI